MKIVKKMLLAGASVLAMTGYAQADPITIGGFLFTNTFLSASFSLGTLITATQVGLGLAVSAGLSLVGGAFGAQQNNGTDPGQFKSVFQSSDASEVNAIGRCKIGGLQVFGNTNDYDRYRLIAHSATPLVAAEQYYLGERPVTVETSGLVSSPPYAKPSGSWVEWNVKGDADGTETAWSDLMSAFPSLWTSDHKLKGISQSLIKYTSPGISTAKFGKLYQTGVPNGAIEGRWCRIYDPREGGADLDDDSTWIWSTNGILCAAHIMRQYPDLADSAFDWDFISDEADKADVLVATKTGTEPRSSMSGTWLSESNRGDTMQEVLDSIGAEIVLSDAGLIRIRLLDDEPDSEMTFVEKHRIDTDWQSGPEAVERPNVCRIKYYSAERGYEMADIDMTGIGWARIDDEVTRYGEKVMDINLPFCPSASQAQRLARRAFLGARADSGVIVTNMSGMAAWGLSYGEVALPDLDESPISKLSAPRCDDENGTVEIPYIVWPQELIDNPWNPATMEADAPPEIPDLSFVSDLDTPVAPSEAIVVQYPDTSYETRIAFTSVVGAVTAEAVYRTYTGSEPDAYAGMTEYLNPGTGWFAWVAENLVGEKVDFKARFFDADEEGSYFSPLLTVNSMAIDNSALSTPNLDVVQTNEPDLSKYYFASTASSDDINVVKLVVTATDSSDVTEQVRPLDEVTGNYEVVAPAIGSKSFDITVTAYTSDGTASTAATYNYVVPGLT